MGIVGVGTATLGWLPTGRLRTLALMVSVGEARIWAAFCLLGS